MYIFCMSFNDVFTWSGDFGSILKTRNSVTKHINSSYITTKFYPEPHSKNWYHASYSISDTEFQRFVYDLRDCIFSVKLINWHLLLSIYKFNFWGFFFWGGGKGGGLLMHWCMHLLELDHLSVTYMYLYL